MAWLGTYKKRIKITISNTNVDSDLAHFPVAIVLGTSVGTANQDVSDIFDEVGASYLKIAFTKSDGTTQIYGDVEQWDNTTEKAVIHVSSSALTVTTAAVTEIYIYFDSTQADNTTYIGLSGGTAAQSVWDSSFKAVYHMNQDPSAGGACILDSTSNDNNSTPNGSMTSGDLVSGTLMGTALDFDGSNDYLTAPNTTSLSPTSQLTIEVVCKPNGSFHGGVIAKGGLGGAQPVWSLLAAGGIWYFRVNRSITEGNGQESGGTSSDNQSKYLAGIYNGSTINLIQNLTSVGSSSYSSALLTVTTSLFLGVYFEPTYVFKGLQEEVRISSVGRTVSWVKATYYSLTDDLVSFSAAEANFNFLPIYKKKTNTLLRR